MLKRKINKELFNAMIDQGSTITIFPQADLRILNVDVIFARPMPKNEQYIDYNSNPLNLLGFTTVDIQVGKNTERHNSHHEVWKKVLDSTRLAESTEHSCGRSDKK